MLRNKSLKFILVQGLMKVYCKWPESKYFKLCRCNSVSVMHFFFLILEATVHIWSTSYSLLTPETLVISIANNNTSQWEAKNPGLGVSEAGFQFQLSQVLIPRPGLHVLYPDGPSVTLQWWPSLTSSSSLPVFCSTISLHRHHLGS